MKWSDDADIAHSLTQAQRLLIKRSRLNVSIILRESGESTKYELFQRLNTGGSQLSDQELRNSIILMLNRDFYRWLHDLASDVNFQECIALSERALIEQYDMELALRFIVFRRLPVEGLRAIGDVAEFLTDKAMEIAVNKSYDFADEARDFARTFALLATAIGADSFRKFDATKNKHTGGFSVSAFEAIALGLGFNARVFNAPPEELATKVRQIWQEQNFRDHSGSGLRASERVPHLVPLGRQLFAP